jgi:NADH-quinone oxidoreductase subunit N
LIGLALPTVLAAGPGPDVAGLLAATLPELLLTAGLLAILLLDCALGPRPKLYPRIAFVTVLATLVVVILGLFVPGTGEGPSTDALSPLLAPLGEALGQGDRAVGPLVVDDLARLFRLLFLAAAALTLLFAARRAEEWFSQSEFHVLLLGSLAGMSLLAASADMLMAYLAFETVSYTGYLMVGYRKEDRGSSEAGLKYVIFGAASSGAMLFGISLLFGLAGSTAMEDVARVLRETGPSPAAVAGAILVFAGIAFKVSAVPFHFWAPDAYSGASAPVAGFLAVASKAAGFAVAMRILGTWSGTPDPVPAEAAFGFLPPGPLPLWLCGAGAVATLVVGNTAALRQTELKRLLAWSSVAHAGYLLMALAVGTGKGVLAEEHVGAPFGGILFYFWVYLLMTLGGFGIVGLLRGPLGGTEIRHYRGLGKRNPLLGVCLVVLMISLTGLPPTAGFWAKVLLFMPVLEAGYYGLAIVGLLASAVSLFYYAALMRAMWLDPPEAGRDEPLTLPAPEWVLVGVSTVPLLVGGLFGWWPAAAGFLNAAREWVGASLR